MGLYLNPGRGEGQLVGPAFGKEKSLISRYGATRITMLASIAEVPEGKMLVCVVHTPSWEAALLVHNQGELDRVLLSKAGGDDRPTTWLLMDRNTVLEMLSEEEQAKLLFYEARA